jgi:hypothetical protein
MPNGAAIEWIAHACVIGEEGIGESCDEPAAGHQSAWHVPRCGTNGHELHQQVTHSGFKREDRFLLSQMRRALSRGPLSRRHELSASGAL